MPTANIYTASQEYAQRPADERFPTLAAMLDHANRDRAMSHEAIYNLRDLRAVVAHPAGVPIGDPKQTALMLESPNGRATFTHYSFGQLVRSIGGAFPRGTQLLRELPPAIAADALNHGLREYATTGTRANMLIRDDESQPFPVIRAATSETYGRVWDAQLYGEVDRYFGDGRKSDGGEWMSPPVWPDTPPGGQYRGDRDSFVIRVDGGSIVTDPRGWSARGSSAQAGGRLHRGIMIRNSEVGECSITIDTVLFDVICGNHILWGAVLDRTFRRRHVGRGAVRDTIRELQTLAHKFNARTASQDERIIRALVEHEIAHTKEAVIDELQKVGYTKAQATEAYTTAEASEYNLSPRSFWGIAAATTRDSQESGWQDERLKLDQLAAAVLKKGATLYAKELVTV